MGAVNPNSPETGRKMDQTQSFEQKFEDSVRRVEERGSRMSDYSKWLFHRELWNATQQEAPKQS